MTPHDELEQRRVAGEHSDYDGSIV